MDTAPSVAAAGGRAAPHVYVLLPGRSAADGVSLKGCWSFPQKLVETLISGSLAGNRVFFCFPAAPRANAEGAANRQVSIPAALGTGSLPA